MSSLEATWSQAEVGRRRGDAAQLAAVDLEVAGLDVSLIAVERVLGLGRGLPLVAPDHVEPGAIECEMEAADPGEQLRGGRSATGLTTRSRGRMRSCGALRLGGGGDGRV